MASLDIAQRKRGVRVKGYTGCRVYIPGEVLEAAGWTPGDPPPFYRVSGHRHSKNTGRVLVNLYREP